MLKIHPFHFNLGKEIVELANFVNKEVDELIEDVLLEKIHQIKGENW